MSFTEKKQNNQNKMSKPKQNRANINKIEENLSPAFDTTQS